jgi:hypothetical protein
MKLFWEIVKYNWQKRKTKRKTLSYTVLFIFLCNFCLFIILFSSSFFSFDYCSDKTLKTDNPDKKNVNKTYWSNFYTTKLKITLSAKDIWNFYAERVLSPFRCDSLVLKTFASCFMARYFLFYNRATWNWTPLCEYFRGEESTVQKKTPNSLEPVWIRREISNFRDKSTSHSTPKKRS